MNHGEIVGFIWGVADLIRRRGVVTTVYDPCCGSGGMLTIAKEHIQGSPTRRGINPAAEVHLFGQEVNPETWAVSKSDMFMLHPDGRDADRIAFGSVLSNDRHAGRSFDYLIANPPYGKDWKRDQDAVEAEHERGAAGRFGAGLPRISDGQLLFLQHMLAHMTPKKDGGSRVAIIMNGSPLFTGGDAGSGESEIRRWILEEDWLEALIALPEQLFYNTGIATYVWVLTNRKPPEWKGLVQLVDATGFWAPMRKSLGDKRREIPPDKAAQIVALRQAFAEGEHVKIFPTTHFGFRKITVERPLRLSFQATAEREVAVEVDLVADAADLVVLVVPDGGVEPGVGHVGFHLAPEVRFNRFRQRHLLRIAQLRVGLGVALVVSADFGGLVALRQGGDHGLAEGRRQIDARPGLGLPQLGEERRAVLEHRRGQRSEQAPDRCLELPALRLFSRLLAGRFLPADGQIEERRVLVASGDSASIWPSTVSVRDCPFSTAAAATRAA